MTTVFSEAVFQAIERDPRFAPPAYDLVRSGLNEATKRFCKEGAEDMHVTGQQLLEGFSAFMLAEFGPMCLTLMEQVGIREWLDVGRIVYNLIEIGYFGKNDGDTLNDFRSASDFQEAFLGPFLPKNPPDASTHPRLDHSVFSNSSRSN